jgi:hypothetical protein
MCALRCCGYWDCFCAGACTLGYSRRRLQFCVVWLRRHFVGRRIFCFRCWETWRCSCRRWGRLPRLLQFWALLVRCIVLMWPRYCRLKPRVLPVVVVEALLEVPTAGSRTRRCLSSGGKDDPPRCVAYAPAHEDVVLRFLTDLDKVA